MKYRLIILLISLLSLCVDLQCMDFANIFDTKKHIATTSSLKDWDWFFEKPVSSNQVSSIACTEDFDDIFGKGREKRPSLSIEFPFPETGQVVRPLPRNLNQTPFKVRAVSQLEEKSFTLPEGVLENKKVYGHFMRYMQQNPIRIFCDTETTGISQYDRIIEIAFVKRNYQTMKETRLYTLLNPDGKISGPKAYEAHKIKDSDLLQQPKFQDVVNQILNFIGTDILVAHNVAFDRRMINSELKRCEKAELPPERFECTLVYSRSIYEGQKNTLDAVCERLGVNLSSRNECHGAMQDTLLLAEIYPTVYVAYNHIKGK